MKSAAGHPSRFSNEGVSVPTESVPPAVAGGFTFQFRRVATFEFRQVVYGLLTNLTKQSRPVGTIDLRAQSSLRDAIYLTLMIAGRKRPA
jgi:hypothetical protein